MNELGEPKMDANETNSEMDEKETQMGILPGEEIYDRRKKLPWNRDVWRRIDQAVYEECKRTQVAAKFLPLHGPLSSGTLTVPADTILVDDKTLSINEGQMTPLIELIAEFTLTPQQVKREEWLGTAVTLATRATNLLKQAEDIIILQGQSAIDGVNGEQHPLFRDEKVRVRSGPANQGLLNSPIVAGVQEITVEPLDPSEDPTRYGENTFEAVAEAYSRLQGGDQLAQAHYGPYALILHHVPYADTFAPLEKTLIMPADRIKPLVSAGFYGTGTLPPPPPAFTGAPPPPFKGILVSLGGNTMDLAIGMDATTEFLQEDKEGRYRFRVYERFALRLKDESSRIILTFNTGSQD